MAKTGTPEYLPAHWVCSLSIFARTLSASRRFSRAGTLIDPLIFSVEKPLNCSKKGKDLLALRVLAEQGVEALKQRADRLWLHSKQGLIVVLALMVQ